MRKVSRDNRITQIQVPDNTEKLKDLIPKLIKSTNDYKNSIQEGNTESRLSEFCHTIRLFDTLIQQQNETTKQNKKSLLVSLTLQFEEMELKRMEILNNLEMHIISPFRQLLNADICSLEDMKQRLEESHSNFESTKLQYDISRTKQKQKDNVLQQMKKQHEESKMNVSLFEMNFLSKLKEVNTKSEIYLSQNLCNFMNEYSLMLETNYKKYLELQPLIKQNYIALIGKREEIANERGTDLNQFLDERLSEVSMIKQGYLFCRKLGKKTRYRRRWFVAMNGMLFIYKSWKNEKEKQKIDLLLCSVKITQNTIPFVNIMGTDKDEGDEDSHKFSFQLISPPNLENIQGTQLELATVLEEERAEWISIIEKSIKFKLEEQQKNKLKIFNRDFLKEIQELSPSNSFCADCNAENPEWASINLGLIVCGQCVGVHRNMGTHISRMRSLTIDIWEEEQFKLMKEIGNEVSNKWWEYSLPLEQKIGKNVDRETRNQFINQKYVQRKWVDPFSSIYSPNELLLLFTEACFQNDIPKIAKFFVDSRINLNQPYNKKMHDKDIKSLSPNLVFKGSETQENKQNNFQIGVSNLTKSPSPSTSPNSLSPRKSPRGHMSQHPNVSPTVGSSTKINKRRSYSNPSQINISSVSKESIPSELNTERQLNNILKEEYFNNTDDVTLFFYILFENKIGTTTLELLIQSGADLKYKDSKGNTSLHVCALIDNPQYSELLVRRGAQKASLNNDSLTPIQLAEKLGNKSKLVSHFFKTGEISNMDNKNEPVLVRKSSIIHFPIEKNHVQEQILIQLSMLKENVLNLRSSLQKSKQNHNYLELAKKAHLVNIILFPN